jgi:hypothetical protein
MLLLIEFDGLIISALEARGYDLHHIVGRLLSKLRIITDKALVIIRKSKTER